MQLLQDLNEADTKSICIYREPQIEIYHFLRLPFQETYHNPMWENVAPLREPKLSVRIKPYWYVYDESFCLFMIVVCRHNHKYNKEIMFLVRKTHK